MKIALLDLLARQVSESNLGQGLAAANPAQPAPETPFAHLLLEQQTAQGGDPLALAQAAAESAGLPVLMLADGSIAFDFDPDALPEGAQLVYPLDAETHPGGGEAAPIEAPAIQEGVSGIAPPTPLAQPAPLDSIAESLGDANGALNPSTVLSTAAIPAAPNVPLGAEPVAEPRASARAIARVGEVVQSEAGRAHNPVIALGANTAPEATAGPGPEVLETAPIREGAQLARRANGEQATVAKPPAAATPSEVKEAPGIPREAQALVRANVQLASVARLEAPQASPTEDGPAAGQPKPVSALARAQASPETVVKAEPLRAVPAAPVAQVLQQAVVGEDASPPPSATPSDGKTVAVAAAIAPRVEIVPGETRAQVETLNHVTKAPSPLGQSAATGDAQPQAGSPDSNGAQARPEAQAQPAPRVNAQQVGKEPSLAATGSDKPVTLAARVEHARLVEGKLSSVPPVTQEPAKLPVESSLTRATLAEALLPAAGAIDDAATVSKPMVHQSAPVELPAVGAIAQTEFGALAKAAAPGDTLEQLQLAERPTLQTAGQSVIKGVRYLAKSGGETITVRLVPESLGAMHIVVKSGGDAIEVTLVSANPNVRETLEQHLPALREALGRDGIDVVKVSIVAHTATVDTTLGGGQLDRQSAEHGSARDGTSRGANAERNNADGDARRYRKPQTEHAGSLDVLV